ncbi:hypothetical protein D3C87_1276770 [compost metagenome]
MIVQGVQRRVGLPQRCQDAWRFAVLAQWQVAAVAARVGDDLVGFVKRLGDIEGFLGAQAQLLRADLLQGTQVERQGRHFAHPLGTQLDHPRARRAAHRRRRLLCQRLVQAAVLIVARVGGRPPLRGKRGAVVQQLHVDGPISDRDEVGNAAVTIHHQAQGRRLHPADRQDPLITGLTPQQGEQSTHVHPDQPVGP